MAILSNDKLNDLRVVRTRKALRNAFCSLCTTKTPKEITISQITETAEINRKTFYLHYEHIDDLVDDVVLTITSEIMSGFSDDTSDKGLKENILAIYLYLESHQPTMNTLLFDPRYLSISKRITDTILSADCFKPLYSSNPMPSVIKGYFSAIFSIYHGWYTEKSASSDPGKSISLEELADRCSKMLLHGINA